MSSQQDKLREIFGEALAKSSPEERERYLAEACADDPDLRRQVEALLLAHGQAGDFLGQNVIAASSPSIGEGPGSLVGRYKLLQQIGEGGFGVVFMAEQQEPVRRMVAIKIIKAGMDTREVVARFEAERQALALMDHPNIAHVLDGGATASGRPYFVMDLVKGIPITEFCEQRQLPTVDRLRLFIQVCAAVQHAHQKGVIHRDLKPSNVLVTLHDGAPVPKVIDFGIVKAIGQRLTDKTLFTRFEQLIGTPAYMSPEQAEWSGLDIDTRSDLYSLGVLLYELLTGTTPLEKDTLARAAFDEIRRMIRESEPPKPSTRLTAIATAAASVHKPSSAEENAPAAGIGADSRRMKERLQEVRGDLDWIVMKALEKDRARRYETANALARDIGRHLEGEPVSACPPSKIYRAGKFIRKHRVAVTAGTMVALALIIGLGASIWSLLQERQAHHRALAAEHQQAILRAEAEADRRKAENESAKSRQVAEFLKDMLKGVGPSAALGRDTTMLKEILDKTAERVGKELKSQPLAEADLSNTLGEVYDELGEYAKAEEMLRGALTQRKNFLGEEHVDVATTLANLGSVLHNKGKLAEAESTSRTALALRRKLLGQEHPDVAESLSGLAETLHAAGKLAEAEAMQRDALAMRRKLFGNDHHKVALALNSLGGVLVDEGRLAEAEATHREALAVFKKQLGDEHPDVAMALNDLALVLACQGKSAEAETKFRESLAIARKVLGTHPHVVMLLHSLASVLRGEDQLDEAEALERESLAMARNLFAPDHPLQVAFRFTLARILQAKGNLAEAEALARESLATRQSPVQNDPRTSQARIVLGDILLDQKKYDEAETLLLSGYEGLQQQQDALAFMDRSSVEQALKSLVEFYEATGRSVQAAEWKRKLAEYNKAADRRNLEEKH